MFSYQMVNLVARSAQDRNKNRYTNDVVVEFINAAQDHIVNQLPTDYLHELVTKINMIITDNISISILPLNFVKFANAEYITLTSGKGKYFTYIDFDTIKNTENVFLKGTDKDPIVYINNNRLVTQDDTSSDIILWYVRKPPKIFNVTDANGFNEIYTVDGVLQTRTGVIPKETIPGINNQYNNGMISFTDMSQSKQNVVAKAEILSSALVGAYFFIFKPTDFLKLNYIPVEDDKFQLGQCWLNPSLHPLIVTYASALLAKEDGNIDGWNAGKLLTDSIIKLTNARFKTDRESVI